MYDVENKVDKYIELSKQIKALRAEQQEIISAFMETGRNFGTEQDVTVSTTSRRVLSISLLKQYVTRELLDRCSSCTQTRAVRIVSKLKPKKEKPNA